MVFILGENLEFWLILFINKPLFSLSFISIFGCESLIRLYSAWLEQIEKLVRDVFEFILLSFEFLNEGL